MDALRRSFKEMVTYKTVKVRAKSAVSVCTDGGGGRRGADSLCSPNARRGTEEKKSETLDASCFKCDVDVTFHRECTRDLLVKSHDELLNLVLPFAISQRFLHRNNSW